LGTALSTPLLKIERRVIMNFSTQAVTEAVWPELTGVLAYGIGALGSSWVDGYMADEGGAPGLMAQNIWTFGSLAGGAYLIGSRKNVDFGKGLVFGSGVGVLLNTMRMIYEKAQAQIPIDPVKLGALVPRSFGRVSKPSALLTQGSRSGNPALGRGSMVRGSLPG
jgi:hypothetical protein